MIFFPVGLVEWPIWIDEFLLPLCISTHFCLKLSMSKCHLFDTYFYESIFINNLLTLLQKTKSLSPKKERQ